MGSRRFTQRIRVLFPEPEGPQTTTTSPASTSRSTPASTWSRPNHLSTFLNWMACAMAPVAALLDHQERVARVDGLANLDVDLLDAPRHHRAELVFHLHRLQNDEPVSGVDRLPHLDLDVHDLARHGALSTWPPAPALPPR